MDNSDHSSARAPASYRQETLQGRVCLRLSGMFDLESLMRLVPIERAITEARQDNLVIDARAAEIHLGSADLHSLVAWLQRSGPQIGPSRVAFLPPTGPNADFDVVMLRRLLDRIGIVLESLEDEAAAITWLGIDDPGVDTARGGVDPA